MNLRKAVNDGLDDAINNGEDDEEIDVGPGLEESRRREGLLKVPNLARSSYTKML